MCSILGFSTLATLSVLVVGCMALGMSLPKIFKAGVAWFKHKFNLDEPSPPTA